MQIKEKRDCQNIWIFTIYTCSFSPSFKELNFQLQNWLQGDLKNKYKPTLGDDLFLLVPLTVLGYYMCASWNLVTVVTAFENFWSLLIQD